MSDLKVGDKAPEFHLPTDGQADVRLSELKGQHVIVYFYPKDDTPGCTKQACAFRDNLPAFEKLETRVIGISKDSAAKHDKFKSKHELNFTLASDEDVQICKAYGVWIEKSMYGKKYMGIDRSTFLINPEGIITHIWRKVKVGGHVEDVLKTLKET